jgi:DNA modification methylase
MVGDIKELAFDYESRYFNTSLLIYADSFEWMNRIPASSIHAMVTDPPYGVKEYNLDNGSICPFLHDGGDACREDEDEHEWAAKLV